MLLNIEWRFLLDIIIVCIYICAVIANNHFIYEPF
jgi:hypothetical protein